MDRWSPHAPDSTKSQIADDAIRKKIDAQDEDDAKPEEPSVRMEKARKPFPAQLERAGVDGGESELEIVLREHEDRHPDRGAIDSPESANDGHQQNVQHDVEVRRSRRPRVARPQRHEDAGPGRDHGCDAIRGETKSECSIPDRLGAKLVLANGFKDPPEARTHDAQKDKERR